MKNLKRVVEKDGFQVWEFGPKGTPVAHMCGFNPHSRQGKGAFSPLMGMSEWEYARPVLKKWAGKCAEADIAVDIYIRETAGYKGWNKMIREANRRHGDKFYSLHYMDHFNFFDGHWKRITLEEAGDYPFGTMFKCDPESDGRWAWIEGKASGSLCCHWHNSKKGKVAANIWQRHIADHLGLKMRHNLALAPGDRAWPMVYKGHMVSIIGEKGFGDNENDAKAMKDGRDTLHLAYFNATLETLEALR
jgi:hypothetical protein